jgi:hypothetical protein
LNGPFIVGEGRYTCSSSVKALFCLHRFRVAIAWL